MHTYPCKIDCPNKKRHCILDCEQYQKVKQEVVDQRVGVMKKEGRFTEKQPSLQDRELIAKIKSGEI